MSDFCDQHGITTPYSPKSNGVVERKKIEPC